MVAGKSAGWISSTTASDSFLDLKWKAFDDAAFHDDPLLTVTETTAADRAASAAETARVLAITTIMVAGHTGVHASRMGTYKRNAEHSPTNGGNVYTKTDDSDTHFYRGEDGDWYISDTADMIEGKNSGYITSTSSLHSPLNLEWQTAVRVDPLLKITGS
jgi:hypothetical protein